MTKRTTRKDITARSRFQMRLDPWWQPLLLAGGATPSNSYLELDEETLTVRFGVLFRDEIPRANIEGASETDWPWWMGVGWRTNLRDLAGLIGSYRGVVEVRLDTPQRVWRLLSCRRLAVSLEEPQAFLDALTASRRVRGAGSRSR